MPYLPLPYSNPPPPLLFALTLESSCAKALLTGEIEEWTERRGGCWVGGGRHGFLSIATDKRLQSIEEFPHISWIIGALREWLLLEISAGYDQDPGRDWSPTAIFIFFPFIFFFFGELGGCFLSAHSPLQLYSFPVPALLPLFPSLPFF